MDCHHLRVHRQRSMGDMAATFFGLECSRRHLRQIIIRSPLRYALLLLRFVRLLIILMPRRVRAIIAVLQRPTIEARAIIIEAAANDLATANDYSTMAVIQW